MTSQITTYAVRYPDEEHWAGWTPGHGAEQLAHDLASRVALTRDGHELVRRSVVAVNASSSAKGGIGGCAVWVPDRTTGEVKGVMEADLQGFRRPEEASPEAFVARDWRREYGGWRVKIVERSAETFECAAGRGVIETIVGRKRAERVVQAYSSFFVFAPDAPEAVRLTFNTVHLDLLVELSVLGRTIANSLEITTGPAAS